MAERFSVHRPLQKRDYLAFGQLQKKTKAKQLWLFCLIFSVMLLAMYAMLLAKGISSPLLLLLAAVVFAVWTFGGELIGLTAYNAVVRTGLPEHYVFYDTQFQVFGGQWSNAVPYTEVTALAETDRLFVLYCRTGAVRLVPKDTLAPQQRDGLRAFLEDTLHCKATFVRPAGKVRFFLLGALVAATIAATVLSPSFTGEPEVPPQTLGRGAYSITLPKGFSGHEVDDDSGIYYQMTDLETYISVFYQTDRRLTLSGFDPAQGTERFMNAILGAAQLTPERTLELENGTLCAFYSDEYDGASYFYCFACLHENGAFWCTEFVCDAALREECEPRFLEWAATIQIAPQS